MGGRLAREGLGAEEVLHPVVDAVAVGVIANAGETTHAGIAADPVGEGLTAATRVDEPFVKPSEAPLFTVMAEFRLLPTSASVPALTEVLPLPVMALVLDIVSMPPPPPRRQAVHSGVRAPV
jgi:hypothetical protein